MVTRPPDANFRIAVFLSSGDDASALRDRVDRIAKMMNAQLDRRSRLHLYVRRWEDEMPHRVAPGRTLLDEFIDMARDSHLTMVLLRTEIRPGTMGEIKGVMQEPSCDLAVVCFNEPGDASLDPALTQFLDDNQYLFQYRYVGGPNSEIAWMTLFGVLFRALAKAAFEQSEGLFHELR